MLLTLEGIDGSGKSTQARLLYDRLRADRHEAVLTREPGGSEGSEGIRKLILEGDTDRWSPETEILLFTAARRDHLERVVLPALSAGKIVVCDRFVDSTRIYQGRSRTDLRRLVDRLHDLTIGREPDKTLLIDIDPSISLERALSRSGRERRFEAFGLGLQIQLRIGFLELAREFPDRIHVIDGGRDVKAVTDEIHAVVLEALA